MYACYKEDAVVSGFVDALMLHALHYLAGS
jgi:hypothetical protein